MAETTNSRTPSPYWRVRKWLLWLPVYVYGFICIEVLLSATLLTIAWKIKSGFAALPVIDPHVEQFMRFLMTLVVCSMALIGALIQVGIVMAWKVWRDTDEGNEALKRAARTHEDMQKNAEATHRALAEKVAAIIARAEEQLRNATDTHSSVERTVQGLEPKVLAVIEREMALLPTELLAAVKGNVAELMAPIVEEELRKLVQNAMIEKEVQTYLQSIGFIRTIATAVIQEAKRQQREGRPNTTQEGRK